MDDNSPVGSQSVTRNQSSSRECGPMALADEENPHVGTKEAKSKKHRLRGPCVSPLPQNQESKEDSVILLKNQDSVLSDDRLLQLKKSRYELLTGKMKEMQCKITGLQKELSETKVTPQLEHQKLEWQGEFCSMRVLRVTKKQNNCCQKTTCHRMKLPC
ncbi:ankyrin repeat domain-containing protein 26-like [Phacochoerus africanus]|uniref:ankyrin repeat domain-containing protein 26-like n=1 Tax=Phacochoerus africanus TaxID=41426 RepID=UPI001FD942E6|nr:ankyrin repeat domain-containing protein 26-like [Phacochoerus africanus]